MHILIVDDSLVSRMMVRRCIEGAGFHDERFSFAGDGAQALELIQAGGIDCLVTDLNMPALDGQELLRAVRETGQHLRLIVVMSSALSAEMLPDLLRLGADAFIRKPITVSAMADAFTFLHAGTDRFHR
jgi:CheY-like chemotaxis protein